MRGRWTTTGGGGRGLGRCRKVTADGSTTRRRIDDPPSPLTWSGPVGVLLPPGGGGQRRRNFGRWGGREDGGATDDGTGRGEEGSRAVSKGDGGRRRRGRGGSMTPPRIDPPERPTFAMKGRPSSPSRRLCFSIRPPSSEGSRDMGRTGLSVKQWGDFADPFAEAAASGRLRFPTRLWDSVVPAA